MAENYDFGGGVYFGNEEYISTYGAANCAYKLVVKLYKDGRLKTLPDRDDVLKEFKRNMHRYGVLTEKI